LPGIGEDRIGLFLEHHLFAAALEGAVLDRALAPFFATLFALFDDLKLEAALCTGIDLAQFHLVAAYHVAPPLSDRRGSVWGILACFGAYVKDSQVSDWKRMNRFVDGYLP
jgi:hypothetical protein